MTLLDDPATPRFTGTVLPPHELTPDELATVDRESAERASAYLAPDTDTEPDTEPDTPVRRRAALAEELAVVRRWQRLAQARLDLATDLLSPAGALAVLGRTAPGESTGDADLADVVALLRGRPEHGAHDAADDLRAVVAVRRALAARAADVAGRLAAADAEVSAGARPPRPCCSRA